MRVRRRLSGRSSSRRQLVGRGSGPRRAGQNGKRGAGQRGIRRLRLELARVDHAGNDEDDDGETEGREKDVHPDLEWTHTRPSVMPYPDAAHTS